MERRDLKIEDLFLFGLGSALVARDKMKTVAEELSRTRDYSREEGRKFMAQAIERGREEWGQGEVAGWLKETLRETVAEMNLATKEDLEQLKRELLTSFQNPR